MSQPPGPLFAWTLDPAWAVALMGGAICGLAYLFGRRYLVGQPAPPPAEKAPALANSLGGVVTDRRASQRRRGSSVEVVLADDAGRQVEGWVADRSVGGLRLVVDEPAPEGASRKVRPRAAGESTPWVEVVVRTCSADAGQWVLGCQFARTPSYNVMLQFG